MKNYMLISENIDVNLKNLAQQSKSEYRSIEKIDYSKNYEKVEQSKNNYRNVENFEKDGLVTKNDQILGDYCKSEFATKSNENFVNQQSNSMYKVYEENSDIRYTQISNEISGDYKNVEIGERSSNMLKKDLHCTGSYNTAEELACNSKIVGKHEFLENSLKDYSSQEYSILKTAEYEEDYKSVLKISDHKS